MSFLMIVRTLIKVTESTKPVCCIQVAVAAASGLGVAPLGPVLKPTIPLPVLQAVSGILVRINLVKIVVSYIFSCWRLLYFIHLDISIMVFHYWTVLVSVDVYTGYKIGFGRLF